MKYLEYSKTGRILFLIIGKKKKVGLSQKSQKLFLLSF